MIDCVIFVALPAEARALINHFSFRIEPDRAYRSYRAGSLMLVETGLGKLNAASAVGAILNTLCQTQSRAPACLNIGLAGADQALGTLLAAHSVSDAASDKTWYPQPTWNLACETIALRTVDKPCRAYQRNLAFDMESAGILAAASKFTTLEFIQCLKVVSDNAEQGIEFVDKSLAIELITQHCNTIEAAVVQLTKLSELLPELQQCGDLLVDLCYSLRISATQKSTVRTLLSQYHARVGELPGAEPLKQLGNAKALIAFLQSGINRSARRY